MASLSTFRVMATRCSSAGVINRRVVGNGSLQLQQKRGMALGGHHGPAPDWQGVDKVVRGYFPHDYQLAMAILGGYTGMIVLYKMSSAIGGKKKAPEAAPVVVAATTKATTEGIPSIESPEFNAFLESVAFEKLLENDESLAKVIESA